MFLVILYHACAFWTEEWFTCNPIDKSTWISIFARWLDTFHIYGFTLVSGYLYYYVYYERKGYTSFGTFAKKKFKRLIVPYYFIAIFWVIPIQKLFFEYDIGMIIKNYVLGCSPNQLWFLLMLMGINIIFFPMTHYMSQKRSIVLIIAMYVTGIFIERLIGNYFMVPRVFKFILFFWIGFNIRGEKIKIVWKIPSFVYALLDLVIFFTMRFCLESTIRYIKLLGNCLAVISNIVGALMIFVVLQRFLCKCTTQSRNIILSFSMISMPMYLFHQQILYFPITLLNGKIHPLEIVIISFFISVCGASLLSLIFMRFRITKFLIGEK